MDKKRIEYVIRIGPEFKKILDKQMASIEYVTHGVIRGSTWEACEVLAKKFKDSL